MKIKVEIRNKKRRFYLNFSDIKKVFTWQDEFIFISKEGTIHRFGLLEVKNIWANGNKIYEKH